MGKCQSKNAIKHVDDSAALGHEMLPDDEDDTRLADKYLMQVEKRNRVSARAIVKNDETLDATGATNTVSGPIPTTSTSLSNDSQLGNLNSTPNHSGTRNHHGSTLRSRAAMLEKAEEDAAMLLSSSMSVSILSPSGASVMSSSSNHSQISRLSGSKSVRSYASGSISSHTTPLQPLQPPKFDTTPLNAGTSVTTSTSSSSGGGAGIGMGLYGGNNHSQNNNPYNFNPSSMTLSYHNNDFLENPHEDDDSVETTEEMMSPDLAGTHDADLALSPLRKPLHSFSEYSNVSTAPHKVSTVATTVWNAQGNINDKTVTNNDNSGLQQQQEQSVMAVGTDKGEIFVYWDAEGSRKNSLQLPTRDGKIRCLDFSTHRPLGSMPIENTGTFAPKLYLAAGGDDCMVVIYELLEDTTFVGTYQYKIVGELEREDRVYALQYSPRTGRYVAMGGFDGMVAIARNNLVYCDADQGTDTSPKNEGAVSSPPLTIISEVMRSGLVLSLAWHLDETRLAVGGSDRTLAVLECQNQSPHHIPGPSLEDEDDEQHLDDEQWGVVGEVERGASILCLDWKCQQGLSQHEDESDGQSAKHDANHEGEDQLSTSRRSLPPPTSSQGLLVIGTSDGSVTIMDMKRKSLVQEITLRASPQSPNVMSPASADSYENDNRVNMRVNSMAWSPDGSLLALAGGNGMVMVLDATSSLFGLVQELYRPASVASLRWLCVPNNNNDDVDVGAKTSSLFLVTGGDEGCVTLYESSVSVPFSQQQQQLGEHIQPSRESPYRSQSRWSTQQEETQDTDEREQQQQQHNANDDESPALPSIVVT
jgi:hypothetical protein